jgi:pimeloyl-ACP methyl ester carboxylesterase
LRIHVAEAGPKDGPSILLVHGFPQNWWEWHRMIGPLAADGYRVLAPDLRGAGWSDAPRGRYLKAEMADDLLAVLDQLGVGRTWVAAHDWGRPARVHPPAAPSRASRRVRRLQHTDAMAEG